MSSALGPVFVYPYPNLQTYAEFTPCLKSLGAAGEKRALF